jgi:HAD superfamily hydrolase (TIGR01509 family)
MAQPVEPGGRAFPFGLVIFDCDGVLVDSEIIAAQVLSRMLTAHGQPSDSGEVLTRYLGRSFTAVKDDYLARTGSPLPEGFEAAEKEALAAAFQAELRPIAGIRDVLVMLQERGHPFALASSSSIPRIRHSLAITGLAPFFEGRIFSASMVERGKPEPDLFLHVAEVMGVAPGRALVIEDSPAGVTAGKAAGMTVWGFTGGQHHAQFDGVVALQSAGADRIIASMSDFAASGWG